MAVVKSPKNNKRKVLWIKKFNNNNKKNLLLMRNYTIARVVLDKTDTRWHLNWKNQNWKQKLLIEYSTFFNED